MAKWKKGKFVIRDGRLEDAGRIIEIYSPHVITSITSLEFKVPSLEEMEKRIKGTLINYPWLVYENEAGIVLGYAYAGEYKEREGYKWTVESAIYVSSNSTGLGVGETLYNELFQILVHQGYVNVLATMSPTNTQSVKFHLKMGFKFAGKMENIGWKFGEWTSVNWYLRHLQEFKKDPPPPIPYSQLVRLDK